MTTKKYILQAWKKGDGWNEINIMLKDSALSSFEKCKESMYESIKESENCKPERYRILNQDGEILEDLCFYDKHLIDYFEWEMRVLYNYGGEKIVACGIMGYNPRSLHFIYTVFRKLGKNGARDEFYYECKDEISKKKQIVDYAQNLYKIQLVEQEIDNIYKFLETDFDNSNDVYYAFEELK